MNEWYFNIEIFLFEWLLHGTNHGIPSACFFSSVQASSVGHQLEGQIGQSFKSVEKDLT